MMPSGLFFKSANDNRDEYHYGDRFDQKQREGMLTIEKLQTNTEEPFKLIYESQHKRKLV